jgi:hypothetical protein
MPRRSENQRLATDELAFGDEHDQHLGYTTIKDGTIISNSFLGPLEICHQDDPPNCAFSVFEFPKPHILQLSIRISILKVIEHPINFSVSSEANLSPLGNRSNMLYSINVPQHAAMRDPYSEGS